MNPSYAPNSVDGLWGVTVPDHLTATDAAALDPAVSPVDLEQQDLEGLFECQSCGKQYTRHCDLNKHLKTHSRPFKCPINECRYHAFGWPTGKELDRHYNDKHSAEPRVFSCLWHGCNYTSRREFNRKQHMEKVHGYDYVRSRAGSREDGPNRPLGPPGDVSPGFVYPRDKLALRTVPDVLLTPSPLDQCYSAHADAASPMDLNGPVPYGPDVYVPWDSPATRLKNNKTILGKLPQTYGPNPPVAIQDSDWLRVPVDPRLCTSSSSGTNSPNDSPVIQAPSSPEELLKALPMIVTPKTSPTVTSQVLTPVSEPSPRLYQESDSRPEATNSRDARPQRQAGTYGLGVSQAGTLNRHGKRQVRFSGGQGEDSDGDDEPPVKRPKAPGGTEDDIGDPKMICPFRKAHPEIYDLNAHSKYYSCHTEHHNISTVVRHLGRPAHHLDVDNSRQAISSFNVTDNEHGHPAAGLCKKCWRAFTDRDAFESHFLAKCETVSRSKREKFQILLRTFCATPSDDNSAADSHSGASGLEDAEGDVVSRREYLTLVDRVAALERMVASQTPGPSQSTPRTLPGQQATVAAARAFTSSPALSSQAFGGYYSFNSGLAQPSGAASGGGGGGGGGDPRPVAVGGGMDSQPAHGSGDQTVGGFYSDTGRLMTGFGGSISRCSDGLSAARRTSPLTTVPGGGAASAAAAAQQQPRTVSDAAYGADAAAAAAATGAGSGSGSGSGNPAALVAHGHGHLQHQHHQHHPAGHHQHGHGQVGAFVAGPGSSGHTGQAPSSQQSANTMMRERWEQAVEVGEAMMGRMDFFNSGGSGDDISKFLNMDSQ